MNRQRRIARNRQAMSTPLVRRIVYDRGLSDAESLSREERLVYLLVDLEICMDMEGWDHFFMSSGMHYYREFVDGLRAAGDTASPEVLQDYERHFRERGVPFEADAIDSFLCDAPDSYFESLRDWREDYSRLSEIRWQKVTEYLDRHGYILMG